MKRKLIRGETRSAVVMRGEYELEGPNGEVHKLIRELDQSKRFRNDSLKRQLLEKIFGVKVEDA